MGLMAQVDRARSTLQSANEQLSEARELLGKPKQEAPKEPEEKGFFGKLKDNLSDIGHTVLDVAGLVPVIGAPADALNGVWYAAEGDWVNAGLSAAGIIPFVGEAAVAGKLGAKGVDALRGADEVADAAREAGEATAREAGQAAKVPGFSDIENAVITEARSMLQAEEMTQLRAAYAAGESVEVRIGGRMIQYEPNLPSSGMTAFGENGFFLGPEAFKSEAELVQTLLHETHRLSTSDIGRGAGVSGAVATSETNAAFEFAERAYRAAFEN
ncbi:hypothetical protein [Aliterella atlantica]|uniref:Uncharacterized protein n=1 Tax=Aliterella atlantica CENA595 TaxID=1618023 RepID=A0A0D8ZT66_9CYAN|nr:hypothetical protein [Aliterella atlantica]KJH71958.1 hypothetical protein UH38_09575 [Aliterella atlantica CENA595]